MNKGLREFYLKSFKYRRKMGFYFGVRGNMGLGRILRISGVKMRNFKSEDYKDASIEGLRVF
jgi:hypothetical protein